MEVRKLLHKKKLKPKTETSLFGSSVNILCIVVLNKTSAFDACIMGGY